MVKLDTNGTNPEMIKSLIDDKLIDFVAMDVKNSFERYDETANVKVDIEENNVVKLYLSQEISDIVQTVQNPLIDSPSFTKNSLEMTTLINDGQKIYVGGLMENSSNKRIRKIPFLGDIPYLGKIFRSEDISKTKTELILLLSVEILFNEKDFENQKLKFVRKK